MKVLIVEDDPLLRDLMNTKLKRVGYDCYTACNGVEGLEQTKKNGPDIILLDITMPIMDGFEMLKRLRTDEQSKTPVVIFSSLGDKEKNLEEGKKLGANAFLIKSQLSLDDVVMTIKDLMENKNS